MMKAKLSVADRKNRVVAYASVGVVVAMVGLTYASVPLYKIFCQVTGYGGTTQRADAAPINAKDKKINIRFDANIASALPWRFYAEQATMDVKIGQQSLAFFSATNISDKVMTGSAIFNVTPPEAGVYFNKIQCFCFNEQTLKPGEKAQMPVDFFVDPAILDDADTKSITQITLSYTFYPVDKPKNVSADGSAIAPVVN